MPPRRPRKHAAVADDGRSEVSSFYGAPSEQVPFTQPQPSGQRRDSQSTFFGRNGDAGFTPQQLDYQSPTYNDRTAGYNSESFSRHPDAVEPVKGGRDEEQGQGAGWDVYADFNNAGPRYSTAFTNPLKGDDGYRPISRPDTIAPKSKKGTSTTYEPEVELVTVPAMGAEWSAQELKDMTKSGKAERRQDERKREWRAFNRDQRGLCGIPWLTRQVIVWFTFGFLIVLGLLLFFVIPRVPSFGFNYSTPIVANGGPAPYFSRVPANFSFNAGVDLQADTDGSFIPVHFRNISAEIYAAETSKLVATGSTGSFTIPPKSLTPVNINMTFAYEATNTSDVTWNMYYLACRNAIAAVNGTRPSLNYRLILTMQISGLIGSYGAATLIRDTACPIQLPVNAG